MSFCLGSAIIHEQMEAIHPFTYSDESEVLDWHAQDRAASRIGGRHGEYSRISSSRYLSAQAKVVCSDLDRNAEEMTDAKKTGFWIGIPPPREIALSYRGFVADAHSVAKREKV